MDVINKYNVLKTRFEKIGKSIQGACRVKYGEFSFNVAKQRPTATV